MDAGGRQAVTSTTTELVRAARKVRAALLSRDALIRRMRSEGSTFREIAIAADMTPQGVKLVCDRVSSG
jgi:hypothetical protein